MRRAPGVRTPKQRAGDDAEELACERLSAAGLRIIARNVRMRIAELDIVAAEGPELVFVEVRSRAASRFGGAADSVGGIKRRHVVRAAQRYLQQHYGDRWPACRFDVFAVDDGRVEWIRGAFGADER